MVTDAPRVSAATCPSDGLLRMLWGRWKAQIVYVLGARGPQRFGALRRLLAGISAKVLTQRLRDLEADGLVWRLDEPTVPSRVTYGLTPMGQDIHTALRVFDAPAERWGLAGPDA